MIIESDERFTLKWDPTSGTEISVWDSKTHREIKCKNYSTELIVKCKPLPVNYCICIRDSLLVSKLPLPKNGSTTIHNIKLIEFTSTPEDVLLTVTCDP